MSLMNSLKASLELKNLVLILILFIQLVLDHHGVGLMDGSQVVNPDVSYLTQQPAEVLQLVRLGQSSEDVACEVITSWTSTFLPSISVIELCHDVRIQLLHEMQSTICRS